MDVTIAAQHWAHLMLVTVIAIACGGPPPPQPPPGPASTGGSGPILKPCQKAEARLVELECKTPDGTPLWKTPEGIPFATACEDAARDGRDWNPHCIATISYCDELEEAYRGGCDD